jgi:hypothetical protein
MKSSRALSIVLIATFSGNSFAHELGFGYIIFSNNGGEQLIETDDLLISKTYFSDEHYQIRFESKENGRVRTSIFEEEGGINPSFSAIEQRYYCGKDVVFLTVRQLPPKFSGSFSYSNQTLAFREDTFEFLSSVFGVFQDIAPLESGVEIDFPFVMRERYLVECKPASATTPFQFSFTDRAPNFRGFDGGE